MLTDTRKSPFAKVWPIGAKDIHWEGGLWGEVIERCAKKTVPHLRKMFEDKNISHIVENFRICAFEASGSHDGTVFGDGDFYKWMESAIYTAYNYDDEKLFQAIDTYIDLISRAQQDDGYISTKQIIGERENTGIKRLGDIDDFEVYNFGHLFTAASLHKRLTGKDTFLSIAIKAADYMKNMYDKAEALDEVQTAVCPSHYMGLIELYRTTGNPNFLETAKKAIRLRDSVKNGSDDNQDRIPLKDQRHIVGHAVRANYLYAGLADLYLEDGDPDYLEVLDHVWADLLDHKLYITGGCGALYNGTSPYGNFFIDQRVHQAYGYDYQLPNITAYNETCASIGSVLWAYRMFQIQPEAEYFNIIERTMLNTNLAAISLSGDKYFYENMLRRTKDLTYELIWPLTRSEYILSYCCPPNLARTLAQSSEYAFMISSNTLWLGLYGSNKAKIHLENGSSFILEEITDYPFDGRITFTLKKLDSFKPFKINLRIPDWTLSGTYSLGHETKAIVPKDASSYLTIDISKPFDTLTLQLNLDMPVRYLQAHPYVEENTGQIAVQRGPLVYCLEACDIGLSLGGQEETVQIDMEKKSSLLDHLVLDPKNTLSPTSYSLDGHRMTALVGDFYYPEASISMDRSTANSLYSPVDTSPLTKVRCRMIPYYAWDNRSFGAMKIWMPRLYQ